MPDEIVLESPVDMHCHFRQGDMLRVVAPLSAASWAGALAMPNTDPPIDSPGAARDYRDEIRRAAGRPDFLPYAALYFRPGLSREFLDGSHWHVLAVKFFPKGLTTNSAHGCDPADPRVFDVLAALEDLDIPLCVHPEAPAYYHDREGAFIGHASLWAREFPRLRIILEHLSDARSLTLLEWPNVYATLTPHHLLTTGNDWFGPPFDPHLYCMPCAKRPEDRTALLRAAVADFPDKVMAGTDSAPHAEGRKQACGCAGVFTAPIALQLYAQAFDEAGALGRLQGFVSDNARRIYRIDPPARQVALRREPFTVPARYGDVIPMWAGRTLDWSILP